MQLSFIQFRSILLFHLYETRAASAFIISMTAVSLPPLHTHLTPTSLPPSFSPSSPPHASSPNGRKEEEKEEGKRRGRASGEKEGQRGVCVAAVAKEEERERGRREFGGGEVGGDEEKEGW